MSWNCLIDIMLEGIIYLHAKFQINIWKSKNIFSHAPSLHLYNNFKDTACVDPLFISLRCPPLFIYTATHRSLRCPHLFICTTPKWLCCPLRWSLVFYRYVGGDYMLVYYYRLGTMEKVIKRKKNKFSFISLSLFHNEQVIRRFIYI